MKKEIYEIFTIQNNIILNMDSIEKLEQIVTDEATLKEICAKYLQAFGTERCTRENIEKILESNLHLNERYFQIYNLSRNIKTNTYSDRYIFIKSKIKEEITPIYNLKENQYCWIFGIYYQKDDHTPVIEDAQNVIEIKLEENIENLTIVLNTFICCYGVLKDRSFLVKKFFYPDITKNSILNKNLKKRDPICLFFNGAISIKYLKQIVSSLPTAPNMIFITGPFGQKLYLYLEELSMNFRRIQFLIIPDAEDTIFPGFPKTFTDINLPLFKKFENIYFTTNPCEIHLRNRKICLLKSPIINEISQQVDTSGDDYMTEISKIILSQYCIDFQNMPNTIFKELPDLFICFDECPSKAISISDTLFVTCCDHKKDGISFIYYDSLSNEAEISSLI
ncbi:hypothetical protein EDEG_00785 [Edhazardia aedis USNM 41457]|uniref:DNA polymerase II subunit 2 n=1 Tax=Edhazardia aedis (strain USNM 41457) TaxID=1003232 RepID=J9DRD1_EDHAE|nr:hypothetical protein EDEG_00785 [Edhazardia aedis USNM 41457]|eukprot:EJW05115.1 hypothetical protein EDEG_00785 [Edhazardia aedis USNM 41457]